jgi:hypothetical protein
MTEYQIELPDYFMSKLHGWEGDSVQGYASIWFVFQPSAPNLNVYVDGLSIMQRVPDSSLAELSGWGEDTVTENNGYWVPSAPAIVSIDESDATHVASGSRDVYVLSYNGSGASELYITPPTLIATLIDRFRLKISTYVPTHLGAGAAIWVVFEDNTGSYCQQFIYSSYDSLQEQAWQFWDRDGDFWWYVGPHFDPTNITAIRITFYGLLNYDIYIDKLYIDRLLTTGASGKGKILSESRDRR